MRAKSTASRRYNASHTLTTRFLLRPMQVRSVLFFVAALTLVSGCGPDKSPADKAPAATVAPPAQELFVDATEASGIKFQHFNGRTGEFYYPEIIGSGVALLDYNNDGKLDVLVLQGISLAADKQAEATKTQCAARLYRNDLVVNPDGSRNLKFTDVTETSGLCSHGYGMGVAVGDFNNDGCVDVFITHFGAPSQLFKNNCDGTFTDVTKKAGVAGNGHWGASATFFDYDHDGLLDLYVVNYVDYKIENNQKCYASTSARDYCAPSAYKPVPGILYHNRGDGTFEDVSVKSGITRAFGAGLGVMGIDLNGDGWPDLYVANDGNPNQLWINQKDGTFKNEADIRGSAVNADGAAEAGMGMDIGDISNNGSESIFLTHLTREKSTIFVNRGEGYFEDRSVEAGVAAPSIPFTGFGTVFFDYDNDGWLDIVAANGAVHLIEELKSPQDPYPLQQKKQLFHNRGDGRFEETTAVAGKVFQVLDVGRGLAAGDLDNDGATDLVVNNNNGPLRVILNKAASAKPWMGLRLMTGKRDAYGARVEVARKGAPTLWRRVRADGSYLSANDPRIVIGLGNATQIDALIVHWPDGKGERFAVPALRQYSTLVQGTGTGVAAK
jgi:enediyne biosynthesis protein E4